MPPSATATAPASTAPASPAGKPATTSASPRPSASATATSHPAHSPTRPRALSYATLRTITRFCHSADPALTDHHVPQLRNLEDASHHRELTALVMPFAHKAWADLQNPDAGAVRFDHDHYLKIWALTEPRIPADFLLLDEAQDTNPAVEQVFNAQRNHAQLVMVGEPEPRLSS